MPRPRLLPAALMAALLLAIANAASPAAEAPRVAPTLARGHYAVDEPIELSVLAVAEREARLSLTHEDSGVVRIALPKDERGHGLAARLVRLEPGTLKPGRYTATLDGEGDGDAEAAAEFHVHASEHPNAFYTGQWTHHDRTPGTVLAKGGWMYLSGDYTGLREPNQGAGPSPTAEAYVAAAMRPYALMILGGGHHLDLDNYNDWGDPWTQRAIVWRVQLAALSHRTLPIAGLHMFDEPGLTWWPTESVGEHEADRNPFVIPYQLEEFVKLTGRAMPRGPFSLTGPRYATTLDDWLAFMDLRMKYIEQAWWATVWATESVHPPFETINQVSSSYGHAAVTDGVDSRQARPYDIVSGHGGYSDLAFGTFQPALSAEAFHGWSWQKPHYFLPMWYTHDWATIRNAVWMPMLADLEGVLYTPEQDFGMDNAKFGYHGSHTVLEIAEINRRIARAGDAIRRVPKTPAPVAVLYSATQVAADIARLNHPRVHEGGAPQYASTHRSAAETAFFQVMETGRVPNWIDEFETISKGVEFLKQWDVIYAPGLTHAKPELVEALEDFIAGGGRLVQYEGDALRIAGATVVPYRTPAYDPYFERMNETGGIMSPHYRDLALRAFAAEHAPTFAEDLEAWLGPQPYATSNADVLLAVHEAGEAAYLLLANNAQDPQNPRGVKHMLVPAETTVTLPRGGVVYDLFNGGTVGAADGTAELRLAAGDGAYWLHLPAEPGPMQLAAEVDGSELEVEVTWGRAGYLPFRIRVLDPAGAETLDLYRATAPADGVTRFRHRFPLGVNAQPGAWTVEVSEWLTGQTVTADAEAQAPRPRQTAAVLDADAVSIYFDDAQKIADLFAGRAAEPPYEKLYHLESQRVFSLDPRKFAVFGEEAAAERVAAALRSKGMSVEVNPPYEIKPFVRQPDRGGAGPIFGDANFENIFAHTVVLPGHELAQRSLERGHISRAVTETFPGPGRAYVQWGSSAYQAAWQNVWVFGDTEAGVAWLLAAAIDGTIGEETAELAAEVAPAAAAPPVELARLRVADSFSTYDTPVGLDAGADGETLYVLLYDGSVTARGRDGAIKWSVRPLIEGAALALSPRGDRVAVSGYPGLVVLDAASGKELGAHRTPPVPADRGSHMGWTKRILEVAWNDAGTLVAGGWTNNAKHDERKPEPVEPIVVLDADGRAVGHELPVIDGDTMGVAFAPGGDTLLVGGPELTAVDAATGKVLWKNPAQGAWRFDFSADGKTAVAGGWGRTAALIDLADGSTRNSASFEGVVGGVAMLPDGDAAVAVWGGTRPLQRLPREGEAEVLFSSRFGFQGVRWSPRREALVGAEQGGRLWTLNAAGQPGALLDEDAGTTVYRLIERNGELLAARMDRQVQRIE